MSKKPKQTKPYQVFPVPEYTIVVFEWSGEGKTPEAIAMNAFKNMQQADAYPVCTVIYPNGKKVTVDLEFVNDEELGTGEE